MVHVEEGLSEHLGDVELLRVELLDLGEEFRWEEVVVIVVGLPVVVRGEQLQLAVSGIAEELGVLCLPPLEP